MVIRMPYECLITAQKMKFPIKDFFSKCDQICNFLWIWSHLLKKFLIEKFLIENFLCSEFSFCAYWRNWETDLKITQIVKWFFRYQELSLYVLQILQTLQYTHFSLHISQYEYFFCHCNKLLWSNRKITVP